MKKLFCCVRNQNDKSRSTKLEKQGVVTSTISWPLDQTHHALSESLFNNIPNEITTQIFQYLSVSDLCNVSLVCRSFKMIVDQDEIWKSKCDSKCNHFYFY